MAHREQRSRSPPQRSNDCLAYLLRLGSASEEKYQQTLARVLNHTDLSKLLSDQSRSSDPTKIWLRNPGDEKHITRIIDEVTNGEKIVFLLMHGDRRTKLQKKQMHCLKKSLCEYFLASELTCCNPGESRFSDRGDSWSLFWEPRATTLANCKYNHEQQSTTMTFDETVLASIGLERAKILEIVGGLDMLFPISILFDAGPIEILGKAYRGHTSNPLDDGTIVPHRTSDRTDCAQLSPVRQPTDLQKGSKLKPDVEEEPVASRVAEAGRRRVAAATEDLLSRRRERRSRSPQQSNDDCLAYLLRVGNPCEEKYQQTLERILNHESLGKFVSEQSHTTEPVRIWVRPGSDKHVREVIKEVSNGEKLVYLKYHGDRRTLFQKKQMHGLKKALGEFCDTSELTNCNPCDVRCGERGDSDSWSIYWEPYATTLVNCTYNHDQQSTTMTFDETVLSFIGLDRPKIRELVGSMVKFFPITILFDAGPIEIMGKAYRGHISNPLDDGTVVAHCAQKANGQVAGQYVVSYSAGLPVTISEDRDSAQVGVVEEGTEICILEFSSQVFKGRVRARIASPSGWISVWAADRSSAFVIKAHTKQRSRSPRRRNNDCLVYLLRHGSASEEKYQQTLAHVLKRKDLKSLLSEQSCSREPPKIWLSKLEHKERVIQLIKEVSRGEKIIFWVMHSDHGTKMQKNQMHGLKKSLGEYFDVSELTCCRPSESRLSEHGDSWSLFWEPSGTTLANCTYNHYQQSTTMTFDETVLASLGLCKSKICEVVGSLVMFFPITILFDAGPIKILGKAYVGHTSNPLYDGTIVPHYRSKLDRDENQSVPIGTTQERWSRFRDARQSWNSDGREVVQENDNAEDFLFMTPRAKAKPRAALSSGSPDIRGTLVEQIE